MQVLKYIAPENKTKDDFVAGLTKQPITNCPTTVAQAYGWAHPYGVEDELVMSVGDYHISNFVIAKRVLPPDVIKQTLSDRVEQLEKQQGYAVAKRERRKMQDEIHFELLPKAFVQRKVYTVFWQESTQKLFVGTNQASVIDLIGQSLAFCNPGWQLKMIETSKPIERQMAAWMLKNTDMPKVLTWGDACELQDRSNRYCKIRFTGSDIDNDDVKQHLRDSMLINNAALVWDNACRFILNTNMACTQIKYLEVEKEQDSQMSDQEKFIADAGVLAPLYARIHEDLLAAFDGMKVQEKTAMVEDLVENF